MNPNIFHQIENIHANPQKLVYEFAGAGSLFLYCMHAVPGSSNTMLESTDRYAKTSLTALLGAEPEKYVSAQTALAMAQKAHARAHTLGGNLGVSCTAAVATNPPRRGADRAFLAIQSDTAQHCKLLSLDKSLSRAAQEEAIAIALILMLAEVLQVSTQGVVIPSGATLSDALSPR